MIVERAAAELAQHGVETPRVDAEWIVAHVLGTTRSEVVAQSQTVDEEQVWPLVRRRAAREPLAYVLGEWGFRRLTLRCDARALVPRPETEVVVERCLALLRAAGSEAPPRVLDVGTGTGAIALALADEAGAHVVATDVSEDALALARENALRNGLTVELVCADLRNGFPAGPFDLVVSNPPYVGTDEWYDLPPEVREWEPRQALVDVGQTGEIAARAWDVLRPRGSLVLEVHEQRAGELADALRARGYVDVRITRDLASCDRVVEARRP